MHVTLEMSKGIHMHVALEMPKGIHRHVVLEMLKRIHTHVALEMQGKQANANKQTQTCMCLLMDVLALLA